MLDHVSQRRIGTCLGLLGGIGLVVALLCHVPDAMRANVLAVQLAHLAANRPAPAIAGTPRPDQIDASRHAWVLARWYGTQGDIPASERAYQLALAQQPDNVLVQLELGNLYASLGRQDEAIHLWRQAGSALYWANLGWRKYQENDLDAATQYLTRAQALDPANPQVQFTCGGFYFDRQQWDQAIAAYSVVIANGPGGAPWLFEAYANRGLARFYAGQGLAVAEADVQRAIALQPTNTWAYIRLCELYREGARLDDALCACENAVALTPESAFAHYYLGRVWFARDEYALAAAEFQAALHHDPDLVAAAQWLTRAQEKH